MNNLVDDIFSPHEMSEDEYKSNLIDIVSDILVKNFPDEKARQVVRSQHNRLNFCCPICGDSLKDPYKKRGNIVLSGRYANLYKCFNCGVSMPVNEFIKKYYDGKPSISFIDYMAKNNPITNLSPDISINTSIEVFNQNKIDSYAISRETIKSLLQLVEVDNNNKNMGHNYLVGRNQFNFEKFLYSPIANKLLVLNLTKSDKIIGIQSRNLNKNLPANTPKYKTYNLTNIHKMLLQDYLHIGEIPQEIDAISMVFNSLLVDYTKPVTVVEGPMDSFLIKNCIALCGANKTLPFIGKFQYLFDDDKTGRKNAIEKLKLGNTVFLWSVFKKDNQIPPAKKWDVNDVINYFASTKKYPNFLKPTYWSNDVFDIMDI